ncbi:MAG TPA: hypothetical protein VGG35_15055 [Streptosporangiaceae bacterium]|jgi:hypothetical protein
MTSPGPGAGQPAATQREHVLIVGRSQAVLADTVALLSDRGYTASATNRFDDVLAEFGVRDLDLAVFGGQVPADTREQLKAGLTAVSPGVIFVDGLAGIPGLIVAQIEGALAARRPQPPQSVSYAPAGRTIDLWISQPADVTVTAWWPTSVVPPDPKSDSLLLLDRHLERGSHAITVPDPVPETAAFAAVRAGPATHVLRLGS